MILTRQNSKKRTSKFFTCIILLFTLCSLSSTAQADVELTADYINYNMGNASGAATGNVHLERKGDTIDGDGPLYADFKNGIFILHNNIKGFLAEKGIYFFGDHLDWRQQEDNNIINLTGNVRFEHKTKARDYNNPPRTTIYTDIITGTTARIETKQDQLTITGPVRADIVSQRTKIYGDNLVWERAGEEKFNVNGHVIIERVTPKASSSGKQQLVTDVMTSDKALYLTQKDFIRLDGNVKGKILSQDATSSCNILTWQKKPNNSIVEMIGATRIVRFDGRETLTANRAKYIELGEGYELENNVELITETRHVNCDKFIKHGKYFKAFDITRFEDKKQRYLAKGDKLVGTLIKNPQTNDDEVAEATLTGNVYFEFINKQNQKSVVTGEKSYYKKDSNTVIITGNPLATRSDGKTIKADQFRIDLATKVYYAEGNAHLVYIKENVKNQKQEKINPKGKKLKRHKRSKAIEADKIEQGQEINGASKTDVGTDSVKETDNKLQEQSEKNKQNKLENDTVDASQQEKTQ